MVTTPLTTLEAAAQLWIMEAARLLEVYVTEHEALNLARAILSDADKTIANELTVLANLRCRCS